MGSGIQSSLTLIPWFPRQIPAKEIRSQERTGRDQQTYYSTHRYKNRNQITLTPLMWLEQMENRTGRALRPKKRGRKRDHANISKLSP